MREVKASILKSELSSARNPPLSRQENNESMKFKFDACKTQIFGEQLFVVLSDFVICDVWTKRQDVQHLINKKTIQYHIHLFFEKKAVVGGHMVELSEEKSMKT